jgi:hypothetical protein
VDPAWSRGHPWNASFHLFLHLRQSVGLLGRGSSPSQGRYLTQIQNEHEETSITWVGFEPTIPVFERAKTYHALNLAATMISELRTTGLLTLSFNLQLPQSVKWLASNRLPYKILYPMFCLAIRAACPIQCNVQYSLLESKIFLPENEGSKFLRDVGERLSDYTTSHTRHHSHCREKLRCHNNT